MSIHPLDRRVATRIRRLARGELSYAEIWRALRPWAERQGLRCPCYETVRAIAAEERRRLAAPRPVPIRIDLVECRVWLA